MSHQPCARKCFAAGNTLARRFYNNVFDQRSKSICTYGSQRFYHDSIGSIVGTSVNGASPPSAHNTSMSYPSRSIRFFSKDATAAATTTKEDSDESTPSEYVFQHPKAEEIFHKMTALQLEEIKTITELINEKLGITISEAEKMAMSGIGVVDGAASSQAEEEAPKEEKTHFDLKLAGFDSKAKIKVIKEVRAITGLGLKEAKEMVEGAPKVIKKDLKLEEAEELKAKLEDLGATIELE